MNIRQKKKRIKNINKELIKEYPFLLVRNRWTGKPIDQPYDFIELDAMPRGWRKAFGLKICEEIKQELIKHNCLSDYHITEIKEKFGELRWYDNYSVGDTSKIIDKYTQLSQKTCIVCGTQRTTKIRDNCGYISPYCDGCYKELLRREERFYSKHSK